MKLGNPFLPAKFDIYKAAIIMEEDWKAVANKKMFLVTNQAELSILSRAAVIRDTTYGLYILEDGSIYFTRLLYPANYTFLDIIFLYQASFDMTELNMLRAKLNDYYESLMSIESLYASIQDYHKTINARISKMAFKFMRFNPLKFRKACRKIGGQFVVDTMDNIPIYGFKLSKVTTGNSVEGTVKYKSITTFFDSSLNIIKFVYEFNKVVYDSTWLIPGIAHLHPHTGDRNFCWGNRASDYSIYKNAKAYEFMLALVKDSLNSYNPESPYINIKKLATVIGMLENRAEGLRAKDSSLRYPVPVNMEEIGLSLTCPNCGAMKTVVGDQEICTNSACKANPHAQISCSVCESLCRCAEWEADFYRYNWICSNNHCPECPNYEPILSEEPHCVQCGVSLKGGDTLSCYYNTCSSASQWHRFDAHQYEYVAQEITYRGIEEAKADYSARWGKTPMVIPEEILKEAKCPVCGGDAHFYRYIEEETIGLICKSHSSFDSHCPVRTVLSTYGIYNSKTEVLKLSKFPAEYLEYWIMLQKVLSSWYTYGDKTGFPSCSNCEDGFTFYPTSPYFPPFHSECCDTLYDFDYLADEVSSTAMELKVSLRMIQRMAEENDLSINNLHKKLKELNNIDGGN